MPHEMCCSWRHDNMLCAVRKEKKENTTKRKTNYCETEISETRQKRPRPKVSDKKNRSETTSSSSAILDQS